MRECLVIYVDAALDRNGRAGCGLAVFIRGRAVYTESFGFSHVGGSAQLEAHVCAGALDLAAARWPYHRVIVRTDCAPVVRSRVPSSDSFRIAVHEVRERCRRGWRVVPCCPCAPSSAAISAPDSKTIGADNSQYSHALTHQIGSGHAAARAGCREMLFKPSRANSCAGFALRLT